MVLELRPDYVFSCYLLTYGAEMRNAKQQILKRRNKNCVIETTMQKERSANMFIKFYVNKTFLHNIIYLI